MLKKVEVKISGDSSYLPGEVIDRIKFDNTNEKLVAEGCREITLIGQTVNSYRWSDGGKTSRLSDLLLKLNAIDGLDRIKFVTNYPRDMTTDLIHAVRDLSKVSHYIHVPAQHGSDDVLFTFARRCDFGLSLTHAK